MLNGSCHPVYTQDIPLRIDKEAASSRFSEDTARSFNLSSKCRPWLYTHPVGLGNPAILQAPLAGPLGKSS